MFLRSLNEDDNGVLGYAPARDMVMVMCRTAGEAADIGVESLGSYFGWGSTTGASR